MSGDHGHTHDHDHEHDLINHDRKILWVILALNAGMFFIELWQGIAAGSTALLADSMDFLSDSFSYGVTLYVLEKSLHTRAKAALLRAFLMLLLAAGALTQGFHNLTTQSTPAFFTMGWVASLALFANATSVILLYKSRERDSNMKSVWLCSRNDMIANIMIIIAAFRVYMTNSLFPDLLVALGIAYLEGGSAIKIIKSANLELRS